jgi:hypothetical protein
MSVFRAASLANLSANSFPFIPVWALTHENSIVCVSVCMYACMYVCMYIYTDIYVYICMYARVYVRRYVCVCVHTQITLLCRSLQTFTCSKLTNNAISREHAAANWSYLENKTAC